MLRRAALLALCAASLSYGSVVAIRVVERTDVLTGRSFGNAGPYERIVARAHFAIDPKLPANRAIADIDLAPRNEAGLVEFSADLYVLKPRDPAKGNGAVLFEVVNRGRKLLLNTFQYAKSSLDPRTADEFGDNFLLEEGFTMVWLGWQFDVPGDPQLMRLHSPIPTQGGRPITGPVRSTYTPSARSLSIPLVDREHKPYPLATPEDPTARLTVRDRVHDERRTIPRSEWQFAREEGGRAVPDPAHIYMKAGFEPGKIYEIIYTGKDPALAGLGPAAVRDLISFFKYGGASTLLADQRRFIRHAIALGTSQSGRFLRTFLYFGFNGDEQSRPVFDGVWAHVAGGGRGFFNHRFGQPSRHGGPLHDSFYPTDIFPFTDIEQTDPETGVTEGLLTRSREGKAVPKIFYTNGSNEYWGRAAALIHTTVDGKEDAPLAPDTRIYYLTGTQHGSGTFPPDRTDVRLLRNPNDYRPAMRALLLRFSAWVRNGTAPPASRYPLIAEGQLAAPEAVRFPKIPGVELPKYPHRAHRLDFGPQFRTAGIVSTEPPKVGKAFPVLVPQTDADGNETSGVAMPEVQAPLGTYVGWNLRDPKIGAPDEMLPLVGGWIPFASTKAEREKNRDPRTSVEERYQDRDDYLRKVAAASQRLIRDGFMLPADYFTVMDRARAQWEYVTGRSR
ncbi:MAG: alpha/beta hydrolase domain-containing protein [Bryobacteraceae bacterium]